DRSGVGVFLVPANAKGVTKKSYPTQDGLHAADITFTGVEVGADAAIGNPEDGLALIERVVDDARSALCAEAVGLMDESLKATVEYIKTRKQFGVAIGTFQSLQHRASDMFVAVEQARSMSMFATMASEFDDAKERAKAVAAAKVQIGKSAKFVGQQSIQLHGGIGMTSAELLARLGAKVVISSRKADACHEVAEGIKKARGDAHVIACNISRHDEVKALIAGTTKQYGKVDILVCNAAVNPYYGPLLDITDEAFDKIMGSNVKSNIWLCALAIPQMAERGNGSVVIISSIGGLRGSTVIGAYGISKAADFA